MRAIRGRILPRVMMLGDRYRNSPIVEGVVAEVGSRIPDVVLARTTGRARLHELTGAGGGVLFFCTPAVPLPPDLDLRTVEVGEGRWADASGALRRCFEPGQVVLVRPDHIVGWLGRPSGAQALDHAIRTALGHRPT